MGNSNRHLAGGGTIDAPLSEKAVPLPDSCPSDPRTLLLRWPLGTCCSAAACARWWLTGQHHQPLALKDCTGVLEGGQGGEAPSTMAGQEPALGFRGTRGQVTQLARRAATFKALPKLLPPSLLQLLTTGNESLSLGMSLFSEHPLVSCIQGEPVGTTGPGGGWARDAG